MDSRGIKERVWYGQQRDIGIGQDTHRTVMWDRIWIVEGYTPHRIGYEFLRDVGKDRIIKEYWIGYGQ